MIMGMKVRWVEVVIGKEKTRYTIGDSFVEDIKLDPEMMSLIVFMKDGSIRQHFGCPCVVCSEESADIVVPKIEIAS